MPTRSIAASTAATSDGRRPVNGGSCGSRPERHDFLHRHPEGQLRELRHDRDGPRDGASIQRPRSACAAQPHRRPRSVAGPRSGRGGASTCRRRWGRPGRVARQRRGTGSRRRRRGPSPTTLTPSAARIGAAGSATGDRRSIARRAPVSTRPSQLVPRPAFAEQEQEERCADEGHDDAHRDVAGQPRHEIGDGQQHAPASAEIGRTRPAAGPTTSRTTCGTTSPTNPISPLMATPAAVAIDATRRARRARGGRRPRGGGQPHRRAASRRGRATRREDEETGPDDERRRDGQSGPGRRRRARPAGTRRSGGGRSPDTYIARVRNAVSTDATAYPVSSSRVRPPGPPEPPSRKTSHAANNAPAKASPCSRLKAKIANWTGSMTATAAPSAAPEAVPSTYGSARGLRNSPWNVAPATARPAPTTIAVRTRGSRRSQTIVAVASV